MEGGETDILEPDSITPLFLVIDFHLCKSATSEQTNSAELSAPSEAWITYHLLHCAKLIMSGVACNGCSEYTTLISTVQRHASLDHNEKIKFNLFGELFVSTWFLAKIYVGALLWIVITENDNWKKKQQQQTNRQSALKVFFFVPLELLIGQDKVQVYCPSASRHCHGTSFFFFFFTYKCRFNQPRWIHFG